MKITFDKRDLPKVKDLVRTWVQLTVVEETDNSITVEGRESTIGIMRRELYFYAQRHDKLNSYKVHLHQDLLNID